MKFNSIEESNKYFINKDDFKNKSFSKIDHATSEFVKDCFLTDTTHLYIVNNKMASDHYSVYAILNDKLYEMFNYIKNEKSTIINNENSLKIQYSFNTNDYSSQYYLPSFFPMIETQEHYTFIIGLEDNEENTLEKQKLPINEFLKINNIKTEKIEAIKPINDNRFIQQLAMVGNRELFNSKKDLSNQILSFEYGLELNSLSQYEGDFKTSLKEKFGNDLIYESYSINNKHLNSFDKNRHVIVTFDNKIEFIDVKLHFEDHIKYKLNNRKIFYNLFEYENYSTVVFFEEPTNLYDFSLILPISIDENEINKIEFGIDTSIFKSKFKIKPTSHILEKTMTRVYSIKTDYQDENLETKLDNNIDTIENI